MNADQQQILIDRYPGLLDIEPCPWGPGMGFTFRVGAAGWFDLLDRFCQTVTSINWSQGTDGIACRVTYIKEKMGELRITCEGANEQIRILMNEVRLAVHADVSGVRAIWDAAHIARKCSGYTLRGPRKTTEQTTTTNRLVFPIAHFFEHPAFESGCIG